MDTGVCAAASKLKPDPHHSLNTSFSLTGWAVVFATPKWWTPSPHA